MFNIAERKYRIIRAASATTLFVYLVFLAWRMFFYAYANYYRVPNAKLEYNLIPLKTILDLLANYRDYSFTVWIYNLLGNIVFFMPLGLLLTLLFRRHNIKTTLVISFFIILLAEVMQLLLRVGVFDIDDIILNLLGCSVGYLFGSRIKKYIYFS